MRRARRGGFWRSLGEALGFFFRVALTLTVVGLAGFLLYAVWREYESNPWTRDGQVQADIVGIAARVNGPMIHVYVKDNQPVKKGDPLFEIDPSTFAAQVASFEAQFALAQTKVGESQREAERRKTLSEQQFVSVEDYQQANARYREDVATAKSIEAQLDLARLNLSYTKIFSPVNGYITNMHLTQGTYVTEGEALMALVDTDSYYVYGFFQETVLQNIKTGDHAVVKLMGYDGQKMDGEVQSIGWAIYRADGSSANLLPNISPTIDWVRLAQRFPVRIKLKYDTKDVQLRVGQTVSVVILKPGVTGTDPFLPWTW